MVNVVRMASQIIPQQKISLQPSGEQVTDAASNVYYEQKPPVELVGRINALTTKMYERMGLDFKKRYVNFISVNEIDALTRSNIGGATFNYRGATFQVQTPSGWQEISGWDRLLCVQIPTVEQLP